MCKKLGLNNFLLFFPSCKDISSVRSQLCLSSFGAYFYEFSGCYNSPMDSFEEEFEPRKLPLNTPMPVSLSTRAITTRQFFLFCTLYFTSLLLLLLPCSLAQYNFNQPYSCLSPRDFCPFYDTDTEKLLNNSSLHK